MFKPSKFRLLIVLLASIAAYLFDHFWISKHIKLLSDIVKIQFEFGMPSIKDFTIPKFGLIPVLFITIVIYILTIIPYKKLKDKREWTTLKDKLKSVLYGLLAIPICMLVGALLYLIFKSIFPETATRIAEAFKVTISFFIINTEHALLTMEGSIASLLGLLVGLYILSKRVT